MGIVSIHSYTAKLKPLRAMLSVRKHTKRAGKPTIDFLVVMQISERVKVHIAMKRHMRPGRRQDRSFTDTLRTYSTRQYHL